jgi:hypothetical protein
VLPLFGSSTPSDVGGHVVRIEKFVGHLSGELCPPPSKYTSKRQALASIGARSLRLQAPRLANSLIPPSGAHPTTDSFST